MQQLCLVSVHHEGSHSTREYCTLEENFLPIPGSFSSLSLWWAWLHELRDASKSLGRCQTNALTVDGSGPDEAPACSDRVSDLRELAGDAV